MDILIAATEAEGNIKTSGLGDFISGLAATSSQNNVSVKSINPNDYNPLNIVLIENFKDKLGCGVLHSKLYGSNFYFVDNNTILII